MKKILKHEDMEEFAGKLVGYYCFSKHKYYINDENYQLKNHQLIAIGIVSKKPTEWFSLGESMSVGYNLNILKKKSFANYKMCSLQTEQIESYAPNGLIMRVVTPEEIQEIVQVIENGEAEFSNEKNWKELIGQDNHFLDF